VYTFLYINVCWSTGVFTCLLPVILADLFGIDRLSDTFGAILCCEGVGAAIGVPLAGKFYIT